jgi:hypothetical protein
LLAWTEMSRGVRLHAVRLGRRAGAVGDPVVDACRVPAPTDWNFHPQGGLAHALSAPGLPLPGVQAAKASLDPCVEVDLPGDQGAAHA